MTQNNDKIVVQTEPKLCFKCKKMYGNSTFKNMCSVCFRESEQQLKKQEVLLNEKLQLKIFEPDTLKDISSFDKQKQKQQKQQQIPNKRQREKTTQKDSKETPGKCTICSKKIGMLGYECKHCSNMFCKFHRIPQDHNCGVDFVSLGKKKLKESNPEIKTLKLTGID